MVVFSPQVVSEVVEYPPKVDGNVIFVTSSIALSQRSIREFKLLHRMAFDGHASAKSLGNIDLVLFLKSSVASSTQPTLALSAMIWFPGKSET